MRKTYEDIIRGLEVDTATATENMERCESRVRVAKDNLVSAHEDHRLAKQQVAFITRNLNEKKRALAEKDKRAEKRATFKRG